jgi:hypothetical protein
MKYTIVVLGLCIALGSVMGCSSTEGKPEGTQPDKTTRMEEPGYAMSDYSYAQKGEFVALMKRELAAMQTDLDYLSAKVEHSSGTTKTEAQAQLDAVRKQWVEVNRQLALAEGADESTWDNVKGGFEKSYGELKSSFQKTRQWLSDKIEP